MKGTGDQTTGAQRSPGAAASGLDLYIEELALHGFRPGDRYAIAAAMERELIRLFGGAGMPPELFGAGGPDSGERSDFLRVDAGTFEMTDNVTPDAVGVQVARAIHCSLGGLDGTSRTSGASSR